MVRHASFASFVLVAVLAGCGVSEAEQAEACAKGVPRAEVESSTDKCNYETNERCFRDLAAACVCAGCASDCAIRPSDPAQPVCD